MEWDAFISHASEDKEEFVRPLAEALIAKGLKVWYDDITLKVGDSLRRSIDRGLAHSKYGVVVISKNFLNKEWPQKELDGLVSREIDGKKVILPVWHKIGAEEVRRYSPMLADRVATSSEFGIDRVVADLLIAMDLSVNIKPTDESREKPIHKINKSVLLKDSIVQALKSAGLESKPALEPEVKVTAHLDTNANLKDALPKDKLVDLITWMENEYSLLIEIVNIIPGSAPLLINAVGISDNYNNEILLKSLEKDYKLRYSEPFRYSFLMANVFTSSFENEQLFTTKSISSIKGFYRDGLGIKHYSNDVKLDQYYESLERN